METLVLSAPKDPELTARLKTVVEAGQRIVHITGRFSLSKRKARKLAYRWRGNRRGQRILKCLLLSQSPAVASFEPPFEYRITKP